MIVLVKGMRISKDDSTWEIIKEFDNLRDTMQEYKLNVEQLKDFRIKSYCRMTTDINSNAWDSVDYTYLIDIKKSKLPKGLPEQIRDWKISQILN